ncbi:MAG: DUF5696 domain-containing protein [Treponema sp.]|nr:DUF5696 domain-containing protein [Treponema sp.]
MKYFTSLLLIIFTSFSFTSCSKNQIKQKPVAVYEFSGSTEDVIIENEFLHLRFFPVTAEIILTDKTNGAQWRSNPPSNTADPLADAVTGYLMNSQFALEYADNSGVGMTLQSSEYSVKRKAYEYKIDGGVLEVNYTVGDITRSFLIPPAMPEERMLSYLAKMEKTSRQFVESSYRLYDINNLRSGDNKDQLLTNYPELARTKIYIMRDNIPDYMKEDIEEYFKEAEYDYSDYIEDSMRYAISRESIKPAFNVTLRYILDGRSLILNIPYDKIAFRQNYPMTMLSVMPFMGSGNTNDDGYILVPDGSGALIYFNNGKQNQVPYNVAVYGWDEAMPREAVISDSKAPFPVFGIQKNNAALLCVIEEGASYASVRADVSGRNCSWNRVFPIFEIVHGVKMNISGRSQRDVYFYEAGLPENESITIRYTPCEEQGYMGMAREYRKWLVEKYPFENSNAKDGIPVAVEIIGAVNKTQHRFGIPLDLPLKLTSYKETASMIEDFANFGWKNVHVKLNGWFNRSIEHTVPLNVKLIKELGSKKDFKKILSAAEKNNFTLYPEADFVFVRDVKTFGGFSLNRDAARYVSRERVQRYPYSFVWFGERKLWGKLNYLARPAAVNRMIDKFVKKSGKLGLKNIAFRNMGAKLAGDYHEKRRVSREASMKMRQQKFDQLRKNGAEILVHGGFAYSAPQASIITDMNIDKQFFSITDAAVPFYQIVLRGLVPYTGNAINLAEDYTRNLLKVAESGAGLYFSFKTEDTSVLQETKFRQFYANEYAKWIGDADAIYKKFTNDFGHLSNLSIIDHQILSQDVTLTEYEDGTKVIVNMSNNAWNYNGNFIDADNYLVTRQGE